MSGRLDLSLDNIPDQVGQWCASVGVVLIPGSVPENGPRQIIKVSADAQSFGGVLAAATTLRPSVVALNITRLDQEAYEARLAAAAECDDKDLAVELAGHKEAVGHVMWVNVGILTEAPCLVLDWVQEASWADLFPADEGEPGDDDFVDDEEPSEAEDPEYQREVQGLARELAESSDFARARNRDQRVYVARKVLGERVREAGLDLSDVIAEATAVFEVEIKPKAAAVLLQEAQSLRKQGLTMAQISEKLGMPASRIQVLLRGH